MTGNRRLNRKIYSHQPLENRHKKTEGTANARVPSEESPHGLRGRGAVAQIDRGFDSSPWESFLLAIFSNRSERMKNVGAQRPTKIPNLSACAGSPFCQKKLSPDLPRYQTAILPAMLRKPQTKQSLLNAFMTTSMKTPRLSHPGKPRVGSSLLVSEKTLESFRSHLSF